eukprot:scaffold7296_cov100-Isochrysis_galbana.AAC.9
MDLEAAAHHYRIAADARNAQASFNLAYMCGSRPRCCEGAALCSDQGRRAVCLASLRAPPLRPRDRLLLPSAAAGTHTASASLRTCTWPSGTTTWPSTCPPRPTCPCSSPCSSCGSSAGGKRARAAPTRPPLSYGGFWPPRGQRREPRYWGPRRRGYRKEGGWRPSGGSSICTSSGTRFSCACSPRRSALSSRCASGSKRAGSWRGATRPLAELEHASHVWRAEM